MAASGRSGRSGRRGGRPGGLIPTALKIDTSAFCPPRHAGEGRYPRLAFVTAKKVVDTGLRRHDEVGVTGESIIRAPGMSWVSKCRTISVRAYRGSTPGLFTNPPKVPNAGQ